MKSVFRIEVASKALGLFFVCAAMAVGAQAQTFTTLYQFNGIGNSYYPNGGLVQGTDGQFYGTGDEAVFKINAKGVFTNLYSFDCDLGPSAGLIEATNGDYYGTTYRCGPIFDINSTVFKITLNGVLTTLHTFDGSDGESVWAALIQARNGDLYGTSYVGGANNYGTIFKITPSGDFTLVHSFSGTDGSLPRASLVQAIDGNFYGTTLSGGTTDNGTVFKLTPSGILTPRLRSPTGCCMVTRLRQWTAGEDLWLGLMG